MQGMHPRHRSPWDLARESSHLRVKTWLHCAKESVVSRSNERPTVQIYLGEEPVVDAEPDRLVLVLVLVPLPTFALELKARVVLDCSVHWIPPNT